ncbi:ABC transporter permease subunit [Hoeflea sp. AS60]|uniref:ABC transporter permease subunit n=1 Tax=Hoeflea sp. AS60 TaxID=3135780 RepID=UPI00316CDB78
MTRFPLNELKRWAGMALGAILPLAVAVVLASLVAETVATLERSDAMPSFFDRWLPSENRFGFLDLFISTGFAAVPGTMLAVIVGTLVAMAIFLEAGRREAIVAEISLYVWAGFPSVVVGILVLATMTPILGYSLATAILAIAVMVLPAYTLAVLSVFHQSDRAVCQAAIANGLTNWQLVRLVLWPGTWRHLAGLAMLTFGRAVGEATCVAIVSGGIVHTLPPGFFDTINTLSTAILRGFPVAGGAHEAAVYSASLLLLALVAASAVIGAYLRLGEIRKPLIARKNLSDPVHDSENEEA